MSRLRLQPSTLVCHSVDVVEALRKVRMYDASCECVCGCSKRSLSFHRRPGCCPSICVTLMGPGAGPGSAHSGLGWLSQMSRPRLQSWHRPLASGLRPFHSLPLSARGLSVNTLFILARQSMGLTGRSSTLSKRLRSSFQINSICAH